MSAGRRVALALALSAVVAGAHAGDAERVEAGRKLYVSSCQRCHGIDLVTSGIGFDLRRFPPHDKVRFVRSVTEGVRAMPAWGATLKPEQIELIWTYIGAVNGWKEEAGVPQ